MTKRDRLNIALGLAMTGVLLFGTLATPAGAHLGGFSHLKSHFFTKSQTWSRGQADLRYLNTCDANGNDRFYQNVAQALVDADPAVTTSYSGDPVVAWTDCSPLAAGPRVKRVSEGVYRVAFPDWWTDQDFLDDLVLANVTAIGSNATASYTVVGESGVGTVLEVTVRNATTGGVTDADFNVTITAWAFDFFAPRTASGSGRLIGTRK